MIVELSDEVIRIKSRIDHPTIDADGHYPEFLLLVGELITEHAGNDVARRFEDWRTSPITFGGNFVEHCQLDEGQFKEFTLTNVARCLTGVNPSVFQGSALEGVDLGLS
jgi:hypothetical protein